MAAGFYVLLTQQDAEMLQETLGKGDFSAGSLELTKDSKRPDGGCHRGALPSSNPLVEAPPHTNGWQTVPLADASDDDVRGRSESDDAKVFMQPGSSPAPPLGESTFRPSAEADPSIAREDVITTYNSEPYELLPRWLKELQRKPYDTFLIGKEPAPIHQKNVGEALESKTPAESTTVAANSPGDRPKSEKPDAGPVPEPVVAQSEKTDGPPETTTKETIARAETGVAADSIRLKTSLLQLSTSCVPKTQDYKFNNSNAPIEN
jgi:hypothetical protein